MKVSFKSLLIMLLGTLIGFTIVSVVRGFSNGEFDWNLWMSWMLGGILGYLILLLLFKLMNRQ